MISQGKSVDRKGTACVACVKTCKIAGSDHIFCHVMYLYIFVKCCTLFIFPIFRLKEFKGIFQ